MTDVVLRHLWLPRIIGGDEGHESTDREPRPGDNEGPHAHGHECERSGRYCVRKMTRGIGPRAGTHLDAELKDPLKAAKRNDPRNLTFGARQASDQSEIRSNAPQHYRNAGDNPRRRGRDQKSSCTQDARRDKSPG